MAKALPDNSVEAVAWALCAHTYPCSSMVDEVMNPENPMFVRLTAARMNATGQTERDWYLQKAAKAIAALVEHLEENDAEISSKDYREIAGLKYTYPTEHE